MPALQPALEKAVRQPGMWLAVALLWVTATFNYLDRQIINSLLPLIQRELSLSGVELGLLASVFLWTYAAFSPLGGFLADRLGPKRVILWSLLFWSAITAATAHTSGYRELLATRALMGLTEAFYLPAALALIAGLHSEATRARATGLHQSGLYAGILLGGWGGAWLGAEYGWRYAFLLLGALGIFYAVPLAATLRAAPSPAVARPDFLSASRQVLGNSRFRVLLVANGITAGAYWCVYTWMPLFLFERFHLTLSQAGFDATFYIQVSSLSGILLGGWIADRWSLISPRARLLVQAIGLGVAAPALVLTALVDSRAWLVVTLVTFGLGRGFYDCNVMPVVCQLLPVPVRATAYGYLNFLASMVGGLTAIIAGHLRDSVGLGHALELAGVFMLIAGASLATLVVCKNHTLTRDSVLDKKN